MSLHKVIQTYQALGRGVWTVRRPNPPLLRWASRPLKPHQRRVEVLPQPR